MLRRFSAAAAVIVTLVLGTGIAAWAHVTIDPGSAPKGGTDQEITFRVPNEDDKADTIKFDVKIPTDHPILGIEAENMPGWKIEVKTEKLAKPITTDDGTVTEAVSQVTWTGGSIPPGTYGAFRIIVGQLPDDTDQISFPAIQTYSGGREVSWIEDSPAGGEEPEHPAPILTLAAAGADGGHTTPTTAPKGVTVGAVSQSDVDSASSKATIGIALGALGIIAGVGGVLLARRRTA